MKRAGRHVVGAVQRGHCFLFRVSRCLRSAPSYDMVSTMDIAPLFLLFGALLVIYGAKNPTHVGYAVLALLAYRALR